MSPFRTCVASTNGMNGFEARALLKRLAKFLAEECYPTGNGFISSRISIDLVRTILGSREVICRIAFVGKEVQDLDFERVIII